MLGFDTIQQGIKGALRVGQTARVLTSTSLSWVLGDRPATPALMRQTFERLGATYIKLGQFIASSPSFFPADYVAEFQLCLDCTEPIPFKVVCRVLREELGHRRIKQIFAEIDPKPLASASIAQVHAAKLVTGEHVVIKVQKPGVQDILLTDLNFLYVSARLLEFLRPTLSVASLSGIVSEIQKTMMEECDFIKEAHHMEIFGEFLRKTDNHQAIVPKVYNHATTRRVLTMERLYGVPFTDLDSICRYSDNPADTLIAAMNTWFASLIFCEFFHADVHAGNLMVLEDGRIGFIDFGIVGRLAPATWTAMTALMTGIEQGDYETIAKAMVSIGITHREVDVARLSQDLQTLFESLEEVQPEDLLQNNVNDNQINQLLLNIVAVGERHGLHFPREFALLLKQFLYFDRYVQLLAPGLNVYGDERINLTPQ
jgi:predicted unusual protein kinase regulating ubiquinone biosynthesis (AarF/ABC1/UbiB family)